jgi:hypothetical protein
VLFELIPQVLSAYVSSPTSEVVRFRPGCAAGGFVDFLLAGMVSSLKKLNEIMNKKSPHFFCVPEKLAGFCLPGIFGILEGNAHVLSICLCVFGEKLQLQLLISWKFK